MAVSFPRDCGRPGANFIVVSVKTNAIRNLTSARISIPAILVPSTSGNPPPWRWRTPLESTAPYWTSTEYGNGSVLFAD
jgi:hypothetical protein